MRPKGKPQKMEKPSNQEHQRYGNSRMEDNDNTGKSGEG